MIKVTREQLLVGEKSLAMLAKAQVPTPVAYRINKIIKQVAEILKETEEIRREIINKYGKKDSNGELVIDKKNNMIEIEEEQKEIFNKEIFILFSENCEINADPLDINFLKNTTMSS